MAKLYGIKDLHGLHDCVLSPVGGPRGVSAKSLFSGVRAYSLTADPTAATAAFAGSSTGQLYCYYCRRRRCCFTPARDVSSHYEWLSCLWFSGNGGRPEIFERDNYTIAILARI